MSKNESQLMKFKRTHGLLCMLNYQILIILLMIILTMKRKSLTIWPNSKENQSWKEVLSPQSSNKWILKRLQHWGMNLSITILMAAEVSAEMKLNLCFKKFFRVVSLITIKYWINRLIQLSIRLIMTKTMKLDTLNFYLQL